jgi:thiol-disulfide isomerase/thioredoxin
MRVALAGLLMVLAGCAAAPSDQDTRGAPIGAGVQSAARAAGFADCGSGARESGGLLVTCLTDGRDIRLPGDDVPAVVNFWASWCAECRDELPLLAQAAHAYQGRVRFAGIMFADHEPLAAIRLARDSAVTYPQYADVAGAAKRHFGLRGLPSTVFIDATGRTVFVKPGAFASRAQLDAAIAKYFGVTP